MTQPVALTIVTDYGLLGECLASMFVSRDTGVVLGVIQTAEEALRCVHQRAPDIILIDTNLPQSTALTLTQQIAQTFPHVRILILGITEEITEVPSYIEAGASGYLLKQARFAELQTIIERVARGETVCSPHLARTMFNRLFELAQTSDAPVSEEPVILSERELDIVRLIADGRSNREIADHLFLSPHTVKNHVYNILKKLCVQRRLEAVKWAAEKGLLKTDS